jgi:putative membrane protein insertion efficiency factor
VKAVVLALLRGYQLTFSAVLGRNCRFLPTCSDYTRQAVEKHGVVAGLWLGLKRIARCGPLGGSRFQGEYDPVPDKACLWHGAARSNHKDCC